MLQNIKDYLLTWITFVIANPTTTRAQSVNHLQLVANVTNAEAIAWFDALAVFFESVGVINNRTYSNMRNDVVAEGALVSQALYSALFQAMRELPETAVIGFAIRSFERDRRVVEITTDIQQVRAYRDALPRPSALIDSQQERAIRKALNDGLRDLRTEREELQARQQ